MALAVLLTVLSPALPGAAQAADPAPTAPEWLAGEVAVAFGSLGAGDLQATLGVHKLTLSGEEHSAAELRTTYENLERLGRGEQFATLLEATLRDRAEAAIEGAFPGANVTVQEATVDRATLQGPRGPDPFHPPVRFALTATVAFDLAGLGLERAGRAVGEEQVRALFEIGATATLPFHLVAPRGWNLTTTFTMPSWARIEAAEGAELGADRGTAAWELHNWRGIASMRQDAPVTLRARDRPVDLPPGARVELALDFRDFVGLSIPGLLAGEKGEVDAHAEARVTVRSLRSADIPSLRARIEGLLPGSIQLPSINADGLRLALDQGLLPPEAEAELDAYFRAQAERRVASLAGSDVGLTGGFAPGTLDAGLISRPADGEPPLVYVLEADFTIPLGADGAKVGAATQEGGGLYSFDLTVDLPRVQGLSTVYRIILPPGIAVAGIDAEDATYERGSEGGRQVVSLTPSSDDAQATFTVAVTGEFVIAKFWYLWLGVVVLVSLVVSAVAVRRLRRHAAAEEATPDADAPARDDAPARPASEGPAPAAPPAEPSAGPSVEPGPGTGEGPGPPPQG